MYNIKEIVVFIILGLVQGFTEPLPISSSGHMVIIEYFLGANFSNLDFKIFVNLASLLAIIIFYRKFIKNIFFDFFSYIFKKEKEKKENFLYVIYIIIACIPSGFCGLLLKDYIDLNFSSIITVIFSLFFTSIILFFISNHSKKNAKSLNSLRSFKIGCGQIIGLVPGVSRSGITTFFGIKNNLSLDDALRFSFMMYIPTSLGALVFSISKETISSFNFLYLLSFISSFIATYISIVLFFKLVKKRNFKYFAIYLLILSTILLFII